MQTNHAKKITPVALLLTTLVFCTASLSFGQQPRESKKSDSAEQVATGGASVESSDETGMPNEQELFDGFSKMLTNVRLTGHFTIDGRSMKDLNEESYEIRSVKKLPEKDAWLIASRIKYGKNDVTLPLIMNVKWAGKTPMIVLDDFTIPGMGTFSARVVFHDKKYAGTWTHDAVGGHLFGRIDAIEESKDDKKSDGDKSEKEASKK